MKNLFFLVVFVVVGTYYNNVNNAIVPYTAEPIVPMTVPSALKMGGYIDIEFKKRMYQKEVARSRKTYPNPKSEKAIETYKTYVKLHTDDENFECYDKLIFKESSWNPNAQNPKSTAYGLGQFLDSTWNIVPQSKTSNPYEQLDAMFYYVDNRYGNACNAWNFWLRNNYY